MRRCVDAAWAITPIVVARRRDVQPAVVAARVLLAIDERVDESCGVGTVPRSRLRPTRSSYVNP